MTEEIKCLNCGKNFKPRNNEQKYCCHKCKYEYSRKYNFIKVKCTNCGKEFKRHRDGIHKNQNIYCSRECELEYKHKQCYEYRKCEICGKIYETKKKSEQRFCSIECQNKWQTTRVGLLNPKYQNITIICDYCGKIFHTHQYNIKNSNNHFCSKKCRQAWYAEILTQSNEWKSKASKRTVKMLENGDFKHTNTSIQIKINNILNDLNIKYVNEKAFVNFAVDNYLIDYNLIIECMGQYWHCDNRKYKEINYSTQVNRIRMDKIKHSYIQNNYGINILYIWEKDINENPLLCKLLIQKYINNKGKLKNYHSFNYVLENNNLLISKKIIIPYMEWNIDDLHNVINISVKRKMSHKQQDKWTKFNCEVCGKEYEELTCHYNKAKHHCCSYKCANILQDTRMTLICPKCHKKFKMTISNYERHKNKKEIFCSRECQVAYNQVKFRCECCGKEVITTNTEYKRNKHHYCSKECFYLDKHSMTNTTRQ